MEYVIVDELHSQLMRKFPDADIVIEDTAGDGNHYYLMITSTLFTGISLLEQHKMVYEALGSEIMNRVHALKIKTFSKL